MYRSVQEMVEESARTNRGLKGSLFWNWETDLIRSPGSYEINSGDSTFDLVKQHAERMKQIQSEKPAYPCDSRKVEAFAFP